MYKRKVLTPEIIFDIYPFVEKEVGKSRVVNNL